MTKSAGKPVSPIRETDDDARALAERLVRGARFGALATLDPATGAPVVTRVATATALDGAPIILVSGLSAHTAAIRAEPRCGLLLGEPGKGDPLAHPRISLSCRAERLDRQSAEGQQARRRYLNRNPKGALYADFPDFAFFRLDPLSASLNGGFGKAYNLAREDLLVDAPAELAEVEQSAIVHMNEDHRDAVAAMARELARCRGEGWHVTGIDGRGIDIAAWRSDGAHRLRFACRNTDRRCAQPSPNWLRRPA
ncbi:MAG: HugZ family protein [Phyllobacteriaceae bacterium]|nr:HugZ family protein [Phyllobacteriaceae bacterium]